MLDGTEHFDCACCSAEHTMRFILDLDDNEIYVDFLLSQYIPWWKRIWTGIRYILGYACHGSYFDGWILCQDDTEKLRDFCNKLIEHNKNEDN